MSAQSGSSRSIAFQVFLGVLLAILVAYALLRGRHDFESYLQDLRQPTTQRGEF